MWAMLLLWGVFSNLIESSTPKRFSNAVFHFVSLDGWNGNQFDFEVNGAVVYTAELTAGYGAYEYICWEGLADIVLNKSTNLSEVRMTLSIQKQDIITLYGSSMRQTMDGAVVYSLDLSEYRPVYPGTDTDDSDSSIH